MSAKVEHSSNDYVLVTPVRNEARFVRHTLEAVAAQTQRPFRWVIVNDGSRDGTKDIVAEYVRRFAFIDLVNLETGDERDFAGKVRAIRAGLESLKSVDYRLVGFLDGDIGFGPDYFAKLGEHFAKDETLGIGGGQVYELIRGEWRAIPNSAYFSVAGAVQMFRRECYEQIGGYRALSRGGIDTVAETEARRLGWRVRTFCELQVMHYGAFQKGKGRPLAAAFRRGVNEYAIGYHPAFQAARLLSTLMARPVVLNALVRTAGYFCGMVRRVRSGVPGETVQYMRREQLSRLGFAPPRVAAGVSNTEREARRAVGK